MRIILSKSNIFKILPHFGLATSRSQQWGFPSECLLLEWFLLEKCFKDDWNIETGFVSQLLPPSSRKKLGKQKCGQRQFKLTGFYLNKKTFRAGFSYFVEEHRWKGSQQQRGRRKHSTPSSYWFFAGEKVQSRSTMAKHAFYARHSDDWCQFFNKFLSRGNLLLIHIFAFVPNLSALRQRQSLIWEVFN